MGSARPRCPSSSILSPHEASLQGGAFQHSGIGRSAAGKLEHASIEARRLAQGSPLVSQKWAGSNSPGASSGSASFSRKHELWHVHTCHLPAAVSTFTRQGSALVFSMSRPQKQHGPNLTSIFPPSTRPPYVRNFTNCKTRDCMKSSSIALAGSRAFRFAMGRAARDFYRLVPLRYLNGFFRCRNHPKM